MRIILLLSLVGVIALHASPASADSTVTVTLNTEGQAIAAAKGKTQQQYQDELAAEVEKTLGLVDVNESMRIFAEATSLSGRGLGVDYASNADAIIFGIAGGVAAGGDPLAETPSGGGAVNISAMVGVPLKRFGLDKWTLSGNGFYRNAKASIVKGGLSTGGVHITRKFGSFTTGKKSVAVAWGGVDVTAGAEYTRWNMTATATKTKAIDEGPPELTVTPKGSLTIKGATWTAPIEITTSVRFLYLLSLYAGAGADFQGGKSEVTATLDSDISAASPLDPMAPKTVVGTATATADGDGKTKRVVGRGLLGLQLNFWKVKLFTQAQITTERVGQVALGLRVAL